MLKHKMLKYVQIIIVRHRSVDLVEAPQRIMQKTRWAENQKKKTKPEQKPKKKKKEKNIMQLIRACS